MLKKAAGLAVQPFLGIRVQKFLVGRDPSTLSSGPMGRRARRPSVFESQVYHRSHDLLLPAKLIVMSLPIRKLLPHEPPLWIRASESILLITICCRPSGENQLCQSDLAGGLFESVAFRQARGDWWVSLFLLMPDHLHALISIPADKVLADVLSHWKEFTAKRLGIRWQRDFFEHRLRAEESYREKSDYILNNPVRRGLAACAADWPYVWMPDSPVHLPDRA